MGSIPIVCGLKAVLKDREEPQIKEEKRHSTIKEWRDIKNFLGFNKFEGRIKIKLLL